MHEENEAEIISAQKARSMVSYLGWGKISAGFKWPSWDGVWWVYKAGHLYKRKKR